MPDTALSSDALRPTAALLSAHIAVDAAIGRSAVKPTGLDPTTCDLLLRVSMSPTGRLRAVDLCDQLKLSPSYVSRRLDRALEAGLIERTPDPSDRRARSIELTDHGRAALETFTPRLVDVVHQVVFETLSKHEIATLIDLLQRIESAATSLHDALEES